MPRLRHGSAVLMIAALGACRRSEPSKTDSGPPSLSSAAISSAVRVDRCSAVRISDRLVLTAAHCVYGYDGRESRALSLVGHRPSRVVESGVFHPERDEVHDWTVLEAESVESLSGVGIATFATREEIVAVENARRGNTETVALWAATFPMPIIREPGAPTVSSHGQLLLTRGRILSTSEYQERVALALTTGATCNDASPKACPPLPPEAMSVWNALDGGFESAPVVQSFVRYQRSSDPLIYHSADYANGSSGGGLFIERTGHYLGLVPMGATPFDRSSRYAGFGALYRVDRMCAESTVMASLPGCQALRGR